MTTRQRGADASDAPSRTDLYSRIIGKIVAELEQGVRPWHRRWNAGKMAGRVTRKLRHNGIPYQGVNTIMLWMAAVTAGYQSPHWLTFRQALALGGNVRKGEHGKLVVYADRIIRTDTNDRGEETERAIPFLKGYTVFNAEQCENLPAQYTVRTDALPPALAQRIEAADQFFAATRAEIRDGGNRAYYAEGADFVQMPPFECFRDAESFATTLAHECVHWTKHDKRLARDFGPTRFGDEGYAREELVAELGAAFLSADLGITPEVRDDHAAYIASWLGASERYALYFHSRQPRAACRRLSARAGTIQRGSSERGGLTASSVAGTEQGGRVELIRDWFVGDSCPSLTPLIASVG